MTATLPRPSILAPLTQHGGYYHPLPYALGPICEPCWLRFGLVVTVAGETPEGHPCVHGEKRRRWWP